MTIESGPPVERSFLQKALLGIAAEIDAPRNRWEKALYDLAGKVGYSQEEIEAEAAKKRPKLIQP